MRRLVPTEEIDLVIVPGLAFDLKGNRLGRGAGYYDRFLKILAPEVPSIGLAFGFQIVEDIPVHLHDMPVFRVLSA